MLKSVFVVSELYYPEETSTGYFLTKIAEGLATEYSVTALCSQPTYSARGNCFPYREMYNGVRIQRCRSTAFDKDKLPLRLLNLITISISITLAAISQVRRNDCMLVVTNPPILPFLLFLAGRIRKAKYILLVHDVYPEVLIASGMVRQKGLLARLLVFLNKRLYNGASRVIVLGRDMQRLVAEKSEGITERLLIIPNWADLDQIVPLQKSSNLLLKNLNLLSKFIIQYSGNMGRTHGLELLVEVAKRLNNRDDIHFLFIGWGAKRQSLQNAVSDNHLRNITLLPSQLRSELSNSLNACDVAIISFIPGMAGISVPSRMYNIMAAGKPIIAVADKDSELAMVVQEENIGWVVRPGHANELTEVILEAQANPGRLVEMGRRARKVAEDKYSFSKVLKDYFSLILTLEDAKVE
jgi:colanic acid biosynthesis glycosyl transferase WcaI